MDVSGDFRCTGNQIQNRNCIENKTKQDVFKISNTKPLVD